MSPLLAWYIALGREICNKMPSFGFSEICLCFARTLSHEEKFLRLSSNHNSEVGYVFCTFLSACGAMWTGRCSGTAVANLASSTSARWWREITYWWGCDWQSNTDVLGGKPTLLLFYTSHTAHMHYFEVEADD